MRTPRGMVAAILIAACTGALASQVKSAPLDLSGTWSLDIYLSDHAEQIARAIQIDTGQFTPDTFGRGGAPEARSGGREDAGRSRFGGDGRPGRDRQTPASRLSDDDRKRLAELTRPVEFPPPTLTITQADEKLTIAAGPGRTETLHPDGRGEKYSLQSGDVNRVASWLGPQLRVTYKLGSPGTLTYTYSIVPTTGQLLIRVNFERVPDNPGPFAIKLVYNRTTGPAT